MSEAAYALTPFDATFFRDGRAFSQADEGLAEGRTMFPPLPTVTAGAMRAAIARANGWRDPSGPWSRSDLMPGDRNDLGGFAFRGPFIVRGTDALFPAPAYLFTKGEGQQATYALASPSDVSGPKAALISADTALWPVTVRAEKQSDSDRANGRSYHDEKLEEGGWKEAKCWLSASGLLAVLLGRIPATAYVNDLSHEETRIGIMRDPVTHTALVGALYAATRHRLIDEASPKQPVARASLVVIVDWPKAFAGSRVLPDIVPLGGDGRFARLEPTAIISPPSLPPKERYTIVLLTPAILDLGALAFPGRLVAIAAKKPSVVGGRTVNAPAINRVMYPAGSTFFMDARGTRDASNILAELQRIRVGEGRDLGFGEFSIGIWPK